MTSTVRGGCLCGAVRFTISERVGLAEYCHCSMCRKAHGAAFSANAVVPSSSLWLESGQESITEYESSPNRRKCFCSKCGSQLFIRRTDRPELTVVALGAIDGEPRVRPERHVFVASKAPWYTICDTLPQFKLYPGFEPEEK
jgi:hypothetical protein